MSYPKPTPTCGTHVFLFYPHRSHLPPILSPFPLHSPTSPRPWTSRRRPRPSQRRTSPRRPPAPANRRSAGPRRPSPALCGVRRWASRSSRWRQPIVPSSGPCAGESSGPGGEKPQDGRSRAGPSMAYASGSKADGSRGADAAAAGPPPSSLSPFLQLRRRRAAISSSLLPRRYLSSVMARSNNRWTRWGPSEGVAHALECALFGACGMRTGHPVHRSARRCGVKNAKGVLEHSVPFPSQYLVLPA
jgi:hypothetical protein